jgi:hypothetical protein
MTWNINAEEMLSIINEGLFPMQMLWMAQSFQLCQLFAYGPAIVKKALKDLPSKEVTYSSMRELLSRASFEKGRGRHLVTGTTKSKTEAHKRRTRAVPRGHKPEEDTEDHAKVYLLIVVIWATKAVRNIICLRCVYRRLIRVLQ